MSLKEKIADLYPLSPMQEGMLFHSLYSPGSGMYFLQTICGLQGPLDAKLFEKAWENAVERHAILRTAFMWENLDKPVQVVFREAPLPFEVLDWKALSNTERAKKRQDFLLRDRQQGFDMTVPPLLRLALCIHGPDRSELIFSYHHLLLDAWSGPLLLGEILAEYQALVDGTSFRPPRRRPYREYIAWLKRQDMSAAEAFWRQSLAGFDQPTALPWDRPAAATPSLPEDSSLTEDYGTLTRRVGSDTTQALEGLARQHSLTLNALVQCLWSLWLGRIQDLEDVVYGVVVAGRPTDLPGAQEMIGLFINTLPLRMQIDRRESLREAVRRLQTRQHSLQEFEFSPLVQIHGWSDVPRELELFESIFIFANYPVSYGAGAETAALQVTGIDNVERTNFPATIEVSRVDGEGALEFKIYYEFQRFDRSTILRMLKQLGRMLGAAASGLDVPCGDLPLLSAASEHQLLVEWTERAVTAPPFTLPGGLAETAERYGMAVAVVLEDEHLTYAELDRRARRIAADLRALGVAPESFAGLLFERSFDLVIGVCGILKAGAAYLPLDPQLPPARLQGMCEDMALTVLLTHTALRPLGERITADATEILDLEALRFGKAGEALFLDAEDAGLQLDHPAYVIYTSGSTGKPKGTVITHRNVSRLFCAAETNYGFDADDVWTLFHSYAFDFSVWEIFGPLLGGGTLVVVPRATSRSPDQILGLLQRSRVTVLNQTPSAFRHLVPAAIEAKPRLALRWVIFGGEAVDLPSLRPWIEHFGDRVPQLINMYGITETTVHVTFRRLRSTEIRAGASNPIGRPLADLEVLIADRRGLPKPIGAVGEIFVGGAGLARAYHRRPSLTAQRFIPHAFTSCPGERLYRTGDAGRFRADGEVEFFGRLDRQVKVRGFRIELGEITAVLTRQATVEQAVVVPLGAGNEVRLVAYVVPRQAELDAAASWRAALAEILPNYMVPAAFISLEALPLTHTGKLDIGALPQPDDRGSRGATTEFVAPRNALERQIAQIWCAVLGLDRVGVNDSFFDIGGHSLAMVQVVGKLRQALDQPLTIVDAFRFPSVHQLAAHLVAQEDAAARTVEQRAQVAKHLDHGKARRQQRLARQRKRLGRD